MQPILLVEDDTPLRQTLKLALEDEGWVVETAADGRQALDRVGRRRPALVVLDWGLPDLDGEGVASGMRATQDEAIPILLMTADGRAATKAERVGAFAYLHKPFELDHLIDLIRRGLGDQ